MHDDAATASHSNKLASSVSNLIKRRNHPAEDPFLEETAQVARSGGTRAAGPQREHRATTEKRAPLAARSSREAQDPLADPALDFARTDASRINRTERDDMREVLDRSTSLASRTGRPVERMTADEFLKLTGGGPVKPSPKPAAAARPVQDSVQPKVDVAAAHAAEPAKAAQDEAERATRASYELERARSLLERAQKMAAGGFPEEARRLAAIAQLLERSHPNLFEADELRPSEFLASLNPSAEESAEPGANETANLAEAQPQEEVETQAAREPIVSRNSAAAVKSGALARSASPAAGGALEIRPGDSKYVELPEPDSDQAGRYSRTPRESILEYHSRRIARPVAGEEPVDLRGKILTTGSELPQRSAARKDRNLLVALAEAVDDAEDPGAEPEVTTAEARNATSEGSGERRLAPSAPQVEQDIFDADARSELAVAPPVPAVGRKPSSVNAAAVAGLVIGLLGMLGLGLWQRAERRHYKAAVNHRAVSAAAPTSAR
jgi:hypothetical protein